MRRLWPIVVVVVAAVALGGCDRGLRRAGGGEDLGANGGGGGGDGGGGAVVDFSSSVTDLGAPSADLSSSTARDMLSSANDLAPATTPDLAPARADLSSGGGGGGGPVTGGPCLSGAPGATALRVRWSNGGGTATPVYEVFGLPDRSRQKAGAYGYQIGFTPSFVDPYLAQGGLQLDSSDFIDLELSTVGLSSIRSATLALYGRSFNTTTSGSFTWQTFDGTGATATSSFPNSAPYTWSAGDMTTELSPGDNRVLIRIKAGGASGSLVVNRVELCLDAS